MGASLLSVLNRHIPLSGGHSHARAATAGDAIAAAQSGDAERQPVVWFEVEDFLRYFDHFRNPTGLQRVPFEIYQEAERLYRGSGRVRFCRLSAYSRQLRPVSFDEITAQYLNPPGAGAPWQTIWAPARAWGKFTTMLPVVVRHPRFFFSIFKAVVRDLVGKRLHRRRFERLVQPGDFIVSLGAAWGV